MEKVLVCFVERIETDPTFQSFVQQMERRGYTACVFFDLVRNGIRPEDSLLLLEHAFADRLGSMPLVLVSNVRVFFELMHRLYHQTFEHFIFYADGQTMPSPAVDPVYSYLLSFGRSEEEQLCKPAYIYSASPHADVHLNIPSQPLSDFTLPVNEEHQSSIRKLYQLNGRYHVFEPVDGEPVAIDLATGLRETGQPDVEQISFHYPDPIPRQVRTALAEIDRAPHLFAKRYESYKDLFDLYLQSFASATHFARRFAIAILEAMANSERLQNRLFVLSFLLSVSPKAEYRNRILEIVLQDERLSPTQRYFVLYQSIRRGFVNSELADGNTGRLQRLLYRQAYQGFRELLFDEDDVFIPKEDRDRNFVIVMTGQLLTLNHAPTKTALDRCYSLIRSMGKKVLLINTKELLTNREYVPFYDIAAGTVLSEYERMDRISYRDLEVPLYQPAAVMPDPAEMRNIIGMVRKYKPYFILSIGGANLSADLCSNIVPVLNLSTTYNRLPITECQFPVIGRPATDSDYATLKEFGFDPGNLIESVFTFDFKKQEHTYSRSELGLPADKTLLAVVGYRLDLEVTEEFLQALLNTVSAGTHLVFVGGFDTGEWVQRMPELKTHATNLGFQEDVLAVLELCDVYVNPKRAGGGSSVVEAMYKGLPAVTLPFGDVSASVPADFKVASYEEMSRLIVRYASDRPFYSDMSRIAKEAAAALMNTDQELERIIRKAESRPGF